MRIPWASLPAKVLHQTKAVEVQDVIEMIFQSTSGKISTRGGIESRRQYFRFRQRTFERRWRNADIPTEIRYTTFVYLQRIESVIADERTLEDITSPNWIANRKRTIVCRRRSYIHRPCFLLRGPRTLHCVIEITLNTGIPDYLNTGLPDYLNI